MGTIFYKQGVCGDLQIPAQKGLGKIARATEEDIFITSIRDGNHSSGSLHYIGMAFDMRPLESKSLHEIRNSLGKNWDCIDESNHWHFEFDPKHFK